LIGLAWPPAAAAGARPPAFAVEKTMSSRNRGRRTPPRLLTIAGSDSGGGAGIQADLKTFAALGGFGMSAVTGITAQNTCAVTGVQLVGPALVTRQIEAVATDLGIDAAKTGMLGSAAIVRAVARAVARHGITPLVVDPVMVAQSGDLLLQADAVDGVRERLLPLATLVTPNLAEAEVLTGRRVRSLRQMEAAARQLGEATGAAVLVKGGHRRADPVDVLWDGESIRHFGGRHVRTRAAHGTGCTLSAAIAALLGAGRGLEDAIVGAKSYVEGALRHAPGFGRGSGPLEHLWVVSGRQRLRGEPARRRRSARRR
jgi:hydroxymethylpyrimidine/phosphomethylpyrimidine kinase